MDGVGAIIISPVRELAMQTFNVLNKIGEFHDFSVGLVTGKSKFGILHSNSTILNLFHDFYFVV